MTVATAPRSSQWEEWVVEACVNETSKWSLRRDWRRDRIRMGKEALGFEVKDHQIQWSNLHDAWDFLLILSATGHGKSMFGNYLLPIHTLYNYPEKRTLTISKTEDKAADFLGVVKNEIDTNEALHHVYGDIRDFGRKWTQDKLFVKRQVKNPFPSLECVGLESQITASRVHIVILDDILDDLNTRTPQSRVKIHDTVIGTIRQRLEPGGKVLSIGTRKHPDDEYTRFEADPTWYVHVEPAIRRWPTNDGTYEGEQQWEYLWSTTQHGRRVITGARVNEGVEYEVLWPERFSIESLLVELKSIGLRMFLRERQNDIRGLVGDLDTDWLRYYALTVESIATAKEMGIPIIELPPVSEWVDHTMSVDYAISSETTANYTAFVEAILDRQGRIFWVTKHMRVPFPKAIKRMVQYWQRGILGIPNWPRARVVGIQKVTLDRAFQQQLEVISALPVVAVPVVGDKTERIISTCSPKMESNRVYIDIADQDLYQEILVFPGEHEDILDAAEVATRLLSTSGSMWAGGAYDDEEEEED